MAGSRLGGLDGPASPYEKPKSSSSLSWGVLGVEDQHVLGLSCPPASITVSPRYQEQSKEQEGDDTMDCVLKASPWRTHPCSSQLLLLNPRWCFHRTALMRDAQHVLGRQRCHSPACSPKGLCSEPPRGKVGEGKAATRTNTAEKANQKKLQCNILPKGHTPK